MTKSTSRQSALNMSASEFRALGHELVDRIAAFYESIEDRPVTPATNLQEIRRLLGPGELPEQSTGAAQLLEELTPLLFDHSLHNGHPKFMGYITSSSAPLGVLADLLASALNANIARWEISPVASEIESRAVRWVSDFIGYDKNASGLMVSGGNMANALAFVAARTCKAPWDIRQHGNYADARRLTAYVSIETHTWVQKAADVCGLGSEGIRWIETDEGGRMRIDRLAERIADDKANGRLPFLVVGTGGSVGIGAVDPLHDIAAICEREDLWFHVDGAYGAPAACLPNAPDDLHVLSLADSVAVDPHKWLYCPIEVACVLTKHGSALADAFSFKPPYYRVVGRGEAGIDFYELGMQNTRGFRALKVWLQLRSVGREAYRASIQEDVRLAERLFDLARGHPEFEAHAVNLSIATFRYVPADLNGSDTERAAEFLDQLNQRILTELQAGGELFVSNAVIHGRYFLRACIVNFRTSEKHINTVTDTVAAVGRRLDQSMRNGKWD